MFPWSSQAPTPDTEDTARPHTRTQSDQPLLLGLPPGITRRHRRSPSPAAREEQAFFPDQMSDTTATATMDIETLRQAAAAAATAAQAAADALAAATGNQNSRKKPDLPAFDPKHIEIWIRRVEAAYTRVNITAAKDKFAHLEAKIGVDLNPKINEFLYGESTDARWTEFVDYLKSEYGKTKRQRAQVFLQGVRREGRRPSQLLASIKESTKDVSIDDIHKEMILQELPVDVQRALATRVEQLTAEETANFADAFFDKEGHVMFKNPTSTINEVAAAPQQQPTLDATETPAEDDTDVNAVYRRPNNRQGAPSGSRFTPPFQQRSQSQRRPFQRNNGNGGSNSSGGGNTGSNAGSNRGSQQPKFRQICFYHQTYADKAKKCEPGCYRYPNTQQSQQNQGNGSAGRRM